MKKLNLKPEEVEAKLRECNGNMAAVGRFFGCTRSNIWHFCNKRKSLQAAATDIREGMKDNAESALQAAVLRGEAWAVCFFLKCQAKDRGYIEKAEVDLRLLDALLEQELGRLAGRGETRTIEAVALPAPHGLNGEAGKVPPGSEPPDGGGRDGAGPVADGPPPLDIG